MAILEKFFKQGEKAARVPPFVASLAASVGGMLGWKRNDAEYLKQYRGWVYACIQARSEAVGDIEFILSKNGEVQDKSDVIDLLYRVNPYMTKHDLIRATQAFLDLTGNAFWYLARDNDGKGAIKEIYPMRPDKVDLVLSKDNPLTLSGYVYKSNDGSKVPFAPNEVLHFKNFNPLGNYPMPHRGMGVVEAASWAIDTDNESQQWNYSFFKNSARPDGVLYKENDMNDEEYQRMKTQWASIYGGSDRAHKVAILTGGLKWQELGRSQKESDFLEQRRFSRDEIFALFRVPKSVLGMIEDVNRANAEASNFVFADRTVRPLMKQITDTLQEFLLPEFGDGFELTFVNPVPVDRAQVIAEYTAGINKWLSRNEIREREGLPPTEGGDTMYGTLAEVPQDTVPPEQAAPKKSSSKGSDKVVDDFIAKLPKKKEAPKRLTSLVRDAYVQIVKNEIDANTKPLKKDLNDYFDAQEKEVIANLRREVKGLEIGEYSMKGAEEIAFDDSDAVETGIDLITPHIEQYIKSSGGQALTQIGVTTPFEENTPAIRAFIKSRAKYFAETINGTTRESLLATIREGLDAGEDFTQISERIATIYDQARDFRTDRIARTEVSAAGNRGYVEAYKQAGIEQVEWVVVNPQDEDCIINGEADPRAIGEEFPSGDSEPPVHPNCECRLVAVQ